MSRVIKIFGKPTKNLLNNLKFAFGEHGLILVHNIQVTGYECIPDTVVENFKHCKSIDGMMLVALVGAWKYHQQLQSNQNLLKPLLPIAAGLDERSLSFVTTALAIALKKPAIAIFYDPRTADDNYEEILSDIWTTRIKDDFWCLVAYEQVQFRDKEIMERTKKVETGMEAFAKQLGIMLGNDPKWVENGSHWAIMRKSAETAREIISRLNKT